eukprot:360089-Chlamydomonas_euryale.AAC.4
MGLRRPQRRPRGTPTREATACRRCMAAAQSRAQRLCRETPHTAKQWCTPRGAGGSQLAAYRVAGHTFCSQWQQQPHPTAATAIAA